MTKENIVKITESDTIGGIMPLKDAVIAVEKPLIEQTLEKTAGNQSKAAKILGINRNTIRSKIKKLGIDAKKWKRG
ncbi:MAG: hypothetical protein A3I73_05425 [Omnitrophica bacterium RIFCSPLOWO2_02_FULL_45_16]|nr:MAG: hypothetical protein A3C51_06575 [Omnitrophica bacterium RIFCSPHIGHO2_02_FULL_46_20]OGW93695.1 MAG: hypothetical protein A3K16_01715 [Omnitrophica bacterium RIFCSPLOWO2_01_FULL_45_24]OGW94040.1 MAG: hypothetical protein A3G36_02645 [Omnitrophica bacterium RIFCSPLOWO2_12_FULL_45_13]OGX00899.1 MAG: hypothetical protein A3I73_05425 [Omnitrophica bacterium RIFCSPLOWO2_02_FULL_45_16]